MIIVSPKYWATYSFKAVGELTRLLPNVLGIAKVYLLHL